MHQRERSDADAECSKSYIQGEGASIALRCRLLLFAVVRIMNNPGLISPEVVEVDVQLATDGGDLYYGSFEASSNTSTE